MLEMLSTKKRAQKLMTAKELERKLIDLRLSSEKSAWVDAGAADDWEGDDEEEEDETHTVPEPRPIDRSYHPKADANISGSSSSAGPSSHRASDSVRNWELIAGSVRGLPVKDGDTMGLVMKVGQVTGDFSFTTKIDDQARFVPLERTASNGDGIKPTRLIIKKVDN